MVFIKFLRKPGRAFIVSFICGESEPNSVVHCSVAIHHAMKQDTPTESTFAFIEPVRVLRRVRHLL